MATTSIQPYNARTTPNTPWLTASESVLTRELNLCAQNAKTTLSQELSDEWFREFSMYEPERLAQAFRGYRRKNKHFPEITDIYKALKQASEAARPAKSKRVFIACRQNGCQDGWRPAGREKFSRYQRCQCLLDHIREMK